MRVAQLLRSKCGKSDVSNKYTARNGHSEPGRGRRGRLHISAMLHKICFSDCVKHDYLHRPFVGIICPEHHHITTASSTYRLRDVHTHLSMVSSQNSTFHTPLQQALPPPCQHDPRLPNGPDTLTIVFGTLATLLAAATLIVAGIKCWLRCSRSQRAHEQSDMERRRVPKQVLCFAKLLSGHHADILQ